MTLTLERLQDNLKQLSPTQRLCIQCVAAVVAIIVLPVVFVVSTLTTLWRYTHFLWIDDIQNVTLASSAGEVEPESTPPLAKSVSSSVSSPVCYHSNAVESPGTLLTTNSPPPRRPLKRVTAFVDCGVRREPGRRAPAFRSSASDYAVCYANPASPASSCSSSSIPTSTSPSCSTPPKGVRRLLPSLHRRATSDPTAASIPSSRTAPAPLASCASSVSGSSSRRSSGSSSSSFSFSAAPASPRRAPSRIPESARRADGRPLNALPGETFEQRYVAPVPVSALFRRTTSPTTCARSFSPSSERPSIQEEDESENAHDCESGGSVRKQDGARRERLGGLRELGRKIRRRVVASRRDAAEMDPYGAGSY